jgi:3-hydroxybutyryl-CoA dehydrogenase
MTGFMSRHVNRTKINTVAVIGAGSRGRTIAKSVLLAGYKTILEDVSRQALDDALAWIKSALDQDSDGNKMERDRHSVKNSLSTAASVEEALREADLVVEAAAEEMEVKIELFTIFDKFAKPNAILASSSASLSLAEMASATFCPERCIGMRFFDSVAKSNEIELVRAPETSEDTVNACRAVAWHMGKEVIVVQDFGDSVRSERPVEVGCRTRRESRWDYESQIEWKTRT